MIATDAATAPEASPVEEAPIGGHRGRQVRRWMRTHPGMVVLLAIPLVLFGLPQLFGWSFLDGDNFLQNFPLRVLVGRDLRHGMLPLWNPYLSSGTPLLGGFNAGAAYPATWLMAVFPIFVAWWLNLALAYDVAIAGMYLFLRRQAIGPTAATFGAATFACSGYMTAQIVHIDLISGAAWVPWTLMAVHALTRPPPDRSERPAPTRLADSRRGWVALLALSIGLNILSGGAEAIIDGAVLVLLYVLGRLFTTGLVGKEHRPALLASVSTVAAGLAGGVALGAAQWVPGLAFIHQSQRATPTYTFFTSGSLPPRLLTLLASPFVLGTNQGRPGTYAGPYNFPEVTSYAGILALIGFCSLFLARYRTRPEARQWRVWYLILVVGLLSALGGETPFGHLMYLVPGISAERLLSRNLLLVDVSLAVLMAWWVHLLLADKAEGRSARPGPIGRRWQKGGRAEIVVTCLPVAFIVVVCLLLWADGPGLERLLQIQAGVTTTERLQEAALVTAGAVVATAATWIALAADRLSAVRLRRLLAAVLAVDLVLFNCFVIRLPTTAAKAQAIGPLSSALRAQVGEGRFIIYDPDEFYTDQLYALGQTDLNVHSGLPSGQGYTALTDGTYFAATGAHYQEDLDPNDLAGSTWDDLNVTTLLSLPSYFVTPVPPSASNRRAIPFPTPLTDYEFDVPPPPGSFALQRGSPRTWYFGGVLTVDSLDVPVLAGSGHDLKVGLVTATGGTRWLPAADTRVVAGGGGGSLELIPPSPRPAAGIVVEATGPRSTTVGTPTLDSAEAGEVALDGRMQDSVQPRHWTFTGTLGHFGVFHNQRPRGWAWVLAPGGGARPAGAVVAGSVPDRNASQQITVRTTAAAVLVRSESWSPGWRATVQKVTPGSPSGGLGPTVTAAVTRTGVIQQVALPGPGEYRVSFSYAPAAAVAGLVVSAAAGAALVLGALAEVVRRRRRIRGRPVAAGGGLSPG